MHTDLLKLLHKAEDDFLTDLDLQSFETQIDSLSDRLALYEWLRDQEQTTFEAVVDQLTKTSGAEIPPTLEPAVKHWVAVLRYCSMAMLLNNADFLERRLLEWLPDIIMVHQLQLNECKVYEALAAQLERQLSEPQWGLLQPFLEQSSQALLDDTVSEMMLSTEQALSAAL